SRLDHPYAAHVYAYGAEPDGVLWIAMEHVRGTPLDRLLAAQGRIALEAFIPLLDRICEVVHSAHEAGITHRDLKPANVMALERAGRLLPRLLDFGIAKLAETGRPMRPPAERAERAEPPATLDSADTTEIVTGRNTATASTRAGSIMGSPPYMA